ncbi:MAG: metallophosphoesterase, partial [Candidatus Korarchaeum sp.]|nr:metallophosphoesterase [Candidatus Korarchaeum sp.]MDW8034953.1 metallophosphoesterase [Candidatus Korarchaeum sp.]
LGYEDALRERGVELPYEQYNWVRRELMSYVEEIGPEVVVLNGDVKHEFSGALSQEWREVLDLISTFRRLGVRVEVVRGNHDNFLIPMIRREGVEVRDPYLRLGDVLVLHGHMETAIPEGVKLIVIGHEHPAITLRDEISVSHKFKVFLDGEYMGFRLLVIPAVSPLAPGTDLLSVRKKDLLSPLLREADLDSFRVIVADKEVGLEDLGPLHAIKIAARVI